MKPIFIPRYSVPCDDINNINYYIYRSISKYGNSHELTFFDNKIHQLDWTTLSYNSSEKAIQLLEQNIDKINWFGLSNNPSAIHILEKYPDKICWRSLCYNKNGLPILKNNIDKLNKEHWMILSKKPYAIPLLEMYPNKIDWAALCMNPGSKNLLLKNKHRINWDIFIAYNYKNYPHIFHDIIEDNLHLILGDSYITQILCSVPEGIIFIKKYWSTIKKNWHWLSENINAIDILEHYPEKICWEYLSRNTNAIHLIEQNLDKIRWDWLSQNQKAIHILRKYPENICWHSLISTNQNALKLLYGNEGLIQTNYEWEIFTRVCDDVQLLKDMYPFIKDCSLHITYNPISPQLLLTLDYENMSKNNENFKEELISKVFSPKRLVFICNTYNISFHDIHEYY
jgi:hypothetical protein